MRLPQRTYVTCAAVPVAGAVGSPTPRSHLEPRMGQEPQIGGRSCRCLPSIRGLIRSCRGLPSRCGLGTSCRSIRGLGQELCRGLPSIRGLGMSCRGLPSIRGLGTSCRGLPSSRGLGTSCRSIRGLGQELPRAALDPRIGHELPRAARAWAKAVWRCTIAPLDQPRPQQRRVGGRLDPRDPRRGRRNSESARARRPPHRRFSPHFGGSSR